MNLRQVTQFLALAETLSFRRAAERLHMAQPPLSISIKRLETELGGPLFVRQRRGLRLTAVGEAILTHARQIAFHADQLRKTAADASEGIGGGLRVGFVGSATYTLFPRVLPAFRARFPLVALDLRERTTAQTLREVERGELDLGLVRYPVTEPTAVNLIPVEHDQLVAALPPDNALARRKRLQLKDLASEPFVSYSATAAPNLARKVISACGAVGFMPNIAQEAVQVQTILSLVESGIGIALVPSVSQAHGGRKVVFRILSDSGDRLDVAIAVAVHPQIESRTAARFRELLIEFGRRSTAGKPAIRPKPARRDDTT